LGAPRRLPLRLSGSMPVYCKKRGRLLAFQRAARTPTAPGRPHCPGRTPTGRATRKLPVAGWPASESCWPGLGRAPRLVRATGPPKAHPGQRPSLPGKRAEVPLAVGCPGSLSEHAVEAACHGSVPRGICGAGKKCRAHPLKTVPLRYGHEPICGSPGAVLPREEARAGASRDPAGSSVPPRGAYPPSPRSLSTGREQRERAPFPSSAARRRDCDASVCGASHHPICFDAFGLGRRCPRRRRPKLPRRRLCSASLACSGTAKRLVVL
jgi:hypothetical protein